MWLSAVAVNAQNYRGEAVPVVQRVDPLEFSRLRFLNFAFGHEGPMDTPLPTPPVANREYFFEADIFGIESAATIRFDLLNSTGGLLQTVTVWKDSDASDDWRFYGFVKVPSEPFRFAVSGTSTTGGTYRSVLNTVFRPSPTGPAEQPVLPPGITPAQTRQLQEMVTAYQREQQARWNQAAIDHPGGTIALRRASVSRIAYEPLNSASGSPIGLRLRYSVQFPARQTIVATPHVFPVYSTPAWRGVVAMKVSAGTINPVPQMVGAQTLQDVLIWGGSATYQAGTTYNFTVDLVPDYVIEGVQTGRYCIYEQKFTNRTVWDALIASNTEVPYTVSISDTETTATIPAFFSQRALYNSFMRDGAVDCGAAPTNRF
jgi:hypothetical protein